MRMRRNRAGACCLLSLAVLSCGRLLGFSDADEPSPISSPPDATAETATGETDPDGGASRFCASVDATFCEDFDLMDAGADGLLAPWYSFANDANGHAIVALGRSAPNALALDGTTALYAEGWVFPMEVGAQSVSIDVELGTLAIPAPAVFFQVTWNEAGWRHGLTMSLPSNGNGQIGEIEGEVNKEVQQPKVNLTRSAWTPGWHRLTLHVDWSASSAEVFVDGASIGQVTMVAPFTPGSLAVELGAYKFDVAAAPKRLLYDDLVVRAR